jgi:hypothetical protein
MRFVTLVLAAGIAVGCAGINAKQADDINARLARIEARLDRLALTTTSTQSSAEAPSVRVGDERARIVAQINDFKARGFTDNYPAIQQLNRELERLDSQDR